MERDGDHREGSLLPASIQEVLDGAVRALAVGPGELRERVAAAGAVLGRLSRHDFRDGRDRQLIDRVRLALMRLDLLEHFPEDAAGRGFDASEEVLEAVAEDIVELRDVSIRRALRDAEADR